ncbi:hypothetical protein HELRODRAFT_160439 [Helobdella robusta]|uniref:TNFR-Cys domain-containing protein n=1 Tax=Helobdella robusta TaxID=6412 RepID=T1EQ91_HELRO|nr:hypothetical protein HELRODRAFT_160439 [Helobdella robusta]ESO06278.1 hypothetical protein HELRODRAFT_160439 [Helobdella robusta]
MLHISKKIYSSLFFISFLPLFQSECWDSLKGGSCYPGFFYNCTQCSKCPENHYIDRIQTFKNATKCKKHTSCNEDQIIDEPGTSTRDTTCKCRDGYVYDSSSESKCIKTVETTVIQITNTTTPLLSVPAADEASFSPTTICAIVLASTGGAIFVVVVTLLIRRRISPKRTRELEVDLTEPKTDLTKNINSNRVSLCRDMIQSAKFWGVLKDGGVYSHDEQEKCQNNEKSKSGANSRLLDFAVKNVDKINKLVDALLITGQEHLARLIDENAIKEIDAKKYSNWKKHGSPPKEKIIFNFYKLIAELRITEELAQYLRQNCNFSEEDYNLLGGKTTDEKVDLILEWCLRDPSRIKCFAEALENAGYSKHAEFLSV